MTQWRTSPAGQGLSKERRMREIDRLVELLNLDADIKQAREWLPAPRACHLGGTSRNSGTNSPCWGGDASRSSVSFESPPCSYHDQQPRCRQRGLSACVTTVGRAAGSAWFRTPSISDTRSNEPSCQIHDPMQRARFLTRCEVTGKRGTGRPVGARLACGATSATPRLSSRASET